MGMKTPGMGAIRIWAIMSPKRRSGPQAPVLRMKPSRRGRVKCGADAKAIHTVITINARRRSGIHGKRRGGSARDMSGRMYPRAPRAETGILDPNLVLVR